MPILDSGFSGGDCSIYAMNAIYATYAIFGRNPRVLRILEPGFGAQGGADREDFGLPILGFGLDFIGERLGDWGITCLKAEHGIKKF